MSAIPMPDRRTPRAKMGDDVLGKVLELEAEQRELVEALRRNAYELATYTAASLVLGVTAAKPADAESSDAK